MELKKKRKEESQAWRKGRDNIEEEKEDTIKRIKNIREDDSPQIPTTRAKWVFAQRKEQ